MVLVNAGRAARHAASITNRPTCGGPKKGGLMGGIGSIGTGGMSSRQARRFCGTNSACGSYDMNTVFNVVCRGNYTNGSQVAAKMAQRGMF